MASKNLTYEELDRFANTIREIKAEGVKLEVCDYVFKIMESDPSTVFPKVGHAPNGLLSIPVTKPRDILLIQLIRAMLSITFKAAIWIKLTSRICRNDNYGM